MEFTFHFSDELDPVAVYAAILSTVIFVIEILKWVFGGAKFEGSSSSNMVVIGGYPEDEKTYVTANINNVGNRKTTVTLVGLQSYKGIQKIFKRKNSRAAMVNHSSPVFALPYNLEIGGEFRSQLIQNEGIVKWSNEEDLYWSIYHTISKRPVLVRIKPITVK